MLTVQVHHIDPATGRFTHVANVTYAVPAVDPAKPNDPTADPHLEALDHAWTRTQNVEGSWSRGAAYEDGTPNPDYAPDIERVAPLHVLDGRLYGLRSSMVGDVFEIAGRRWAVAEMGFQEIAAEPATEPRRWPGRNDGYDARLLREIDEAPRDEDGNRLDGDDEPIEDAEVDQ